MIIHITEKCTNTLNHKLKKNFYQHKQISPHKHNKPSNETDQITPITRNEKLSHALIFAQYVIKNSYTRVVTTGQHKKHENKGIKISRLTKKFKNLIIDSYSWKNKRDKSQLCLRKRKRGFREAKMTCGNSGKNDLTPKSTSTGWSRVIVIQLRLRFSTKVQNDYNTPHWV